MLEWYWALLIALLTFLVGLFTKNFLPSYMDEKGKNLATKEDIQEITDLTERVQKEFKEEFERFSHDIQFKYDYYFHQYEVLYSYLYAIVVQSEYVRKTIVTTDKGTPLSFEEYPFLTISKTHQTNQKLERKKGVPARFTQTTEEIETPISEFNFDSLIATVIDNGKYADQELLKKSVAYRFIDSIGKGDSQYEDEGLQLQADIVMHIVKYYNTLRNELKMDFSQEEIETGKIVL